MAANQAFQLEESTQFDFCYSLILVYSKIRNLKYSRKWFDTKQQFIRIST